MLSDAEIGNVDTTALYGILRKLLTAQEDKEGINDHEEWGEVGFQIDDHTRGQLYSSNCCSLLFHNNALLCFFFLRCSSRRRPETTKRQTDYYRCHVQLLVVDGHILAELRSSPRALKLPYPENSLSAVLCSKALYIVKTSSEASGREKKNLFCSSPLFGG